jgi:uncharacterized protein involved in exopolysaccharide biosynthesis
VDSNLQVIQNTQLQVQALVESIDRDRDRRLVIERSLADARAEAKTSADTTTAPTQGADADPLDAARRALAALEARLTPEHPDVIQARRQVRELEARKPAASSPSQAAAPPVHLSTANMAREIRLRNLESEIESLDKKIANKEAEERRLRGVMANYEARVEAAPERESELIELTRDYTTLQQVYTTLLTKREDSKVAVNLERRQAGEQFRILDAARIPQRPFSPNRLMMNVAGALAGLVLGLGLAALFEYLDTSLRTDDDVLTAVSLPVLAMIPLILTSAEERKQLQSRWLVVASAAAVVALGMAAFIWKVAAH